MLHTRFTEIFGLRYPIMSAPMAMHSGASIAAAVSSAGALGSFGGMNPSGPEWIRGEVTAVRAATDRPFAVGFITPFLQFGAPLFEATLDTAVPVVMFSFSDPRPWIERAAQAGARTICQVQTLADADLAAEAGADVLVAQGTEAGGHTGSMSLLPLLSAVVARHPDIPVLAAGGITAGPALAAALTAGADGAVLGTAFLATPEAVQVRDVHKDLIVASDGGDTVRTRAFDIVSGLPWPESIGERVRRNRFTAEWDEREAELTERREEFAGQNPFLVEDPNPETEPIAYGQGAGSIDAVRPAAEVLERICGAAEQVLRSRAPALLGTDAR
ncbi:NAD(P)H-dependent flavin oxidoreductase [[Mycobacterium] zoologicum]|uniref:NAD(P)H-dependent flavin oxidoreductase n=1 Tax=[Mycobacterium] zoologicum TaxID=2872311 RepID=UPI001CDA69F6|nr:nitronate monooxygenase [Mycolicibacter sp. MYC101]MEB3062397.1 nitronate monooxygenase [Mycolicibacter sp. MYC101]